MKEYRLRLGSREIPIRRTLQDAKPSTYVDGGGTQGTSRFQKQEISRDQLLKYREVRESGGPIAAILKASGLLTFGTGTEWDVEDEALQDWLEENIPTRDIDLFAIQAGTDAHTYPGVPIETVENRVGEFSHFECVEPWTVIPVTDDHGDIVAFRQEVKVNGETRTQRLEQDELGYIVINRSNGRDKTGVSLLQQNWNEIEHYIDTREATKNSAQLHGFPQRQIKVGREGMSPPNDNELRRIRQRFSRSWDELTMFVTGRDVDIDTLEATDFDFQGLTEDAIKTLMLSFLLPQELGNVGSDGLGSGMPAELRKELLMIGIEAKQRDFASQFVDQLVRPVVEKYSPHNPDDINRLKFKQPLEDETDELERLEKKIQIGEKAAQNGLDVRFEAGDIEIESGEFEVQDQGGEALPGGGGGLFSERRDGVYLSTPEGVPDNAVGPVQDRDEIPENASVVQGPGGGLYYIPGGGESGAGESGISEDAIQEATADLPPEYDGNTEELENAVNEIVENGGTYSQAVEAVETSVDGLDDEARATVRQQAYVNRTRELELNGETVDAKPVIDTFSRDIRVEAEDMLNDKLPDDFSRDYVEKKGDAWFEMAGDTMLNTDTSDIWVAARNETGNTNAPADAEVDLESRTIQDFEEEFLQTQKENTEEVLRELFGDTVPVSRGVSGGFAKEIRQAKENNEPIELDHRTLESWSTFPDHAQEFAGDDGIIIETEVPVEDIWMSSFTTPGLEEHENEIVVAKDGPESYDPENIHIPDDEGMAELYDVAAKRGT